MLDTEEIVAAVAATLAARYAREGFPGFAEAGTEAGGLARTALEGRSARPGAPADLALRGAAECCFATAEFLPVLDAAGAGDAGRRAFCDAFAAALDPTRAGSLDLARRRGIALRSLGCS